MFYWIHNLAIDIRLTARTLMKTPIFTITAVGTLTLGISVSITVFSILNYFLFEPLPYPDSERIVKLRNSGENNSGSFPFSSPEYNELRLSSKCFDSVSCFCTVQMVLSGNPAEALDGIKCTASMRRVLEIKPILGRWFSESEEKENAANVVVISYAIWKNRYDLDSALIGKPITLDGKEYTLIGIMPKNFHFYPLKPDFYIPLVLHPEKDGRGSHWLEVLAKIRSGIAPVQVKAEMEHLGQIISTKDYPFSLEYMPLARALFRQFYQGIYLAQCAALFILLLACAGTGGMMLARTNHHLGHYAIRSALGATWNSLLRIVVIESLLLSLLASTGGLACAIGLVKILYRHVGEIFLLQTYIVANKNVFLFALVLWGSVTTLTIMPSLFLIAKANVHGTLKGGTLQHTASLGSQKRFRLLIIAQIALTLPLLNITMLLLDSYYKILMNSKTFVTDHVLTAQIVLGKDRYLNPRSRPLLRDSLVEMLNDLPDVKSSGITSKLPFEGGTNGGFTIPGQDLADGNKKNNFKYAEMSCVSPGYFSALGITLYQGRWLAETDAISTPQGVLVNKMLAACFGTGNSPIGRIISTDCDYQIAGVVGNSPQWGAEKPVIPEIYFMKNGGPAWLNETAEGCEERLYIVLRTEENAERYIPIIRQKLRQINPDLALANVRTMEDIYLETTKMRRLMTGLFNGFVCLSLIITAIGIYGTLAFHVAVKTKEIGICMALGAATKDVLLLVMGPTLRHLAIGLGFGMLITLGLGKILRSLLYETSPWNPLHLSISLLIICIVTILACWIPARYAAGLSPTEALRHE